jgi:hypothetical protein
VYCIDASQRRIAALRGSLPKILLATPGKGETVLRDREVVLRELDVKTNEGTALVKYCLSAPTEPKRTGDKP